MTKWIAIIVLAAGCSTLAGIGTDGSDEVYVSSADIPEGVTVGAVRTGVQAPDGGDVLIVSRSEADEHGLEVLPPPVDDAPSAVEGVWRAVDPLIPDGPWKALGPFALYFLAKLGSRRYRQNLASAVRSTGKLDGKGLIRGIAAAEGFVHTEKPS